MTEVFTLLAVYQVKHFLADFPLQRPWMLGKFSDKPSAWVPALLGHALVHGIATWIILWAFNRPDLTWLSPLDAGIHFVIDRVKASPNLLGRFSALSKHEMQRYVGERSCADEAHSEAARTLIRGNTLFWWSLGLDQMAHHLTHYYIIWRIVT